jgi:DNA polymerase elongation subunit (family B)
MSEQVCGPSEKSNEIPIEFFPYYWHLDPEEEERTVIRVYGFTRENKNICVHVNDFTPFIYLELPTNIEWTVERAQIYSNVISDKLEDIHQPIVCKLMYKKKLYRANLDLSGEKMKFPFLFMAFRSKQGIYKLGWKIKYEQEIPGISGERDVNGRIIGRIRTIMHEDNVRPILQMICLRKITYTDWISCTAKQMKNKETLCDFEYSVYWKKLNPLSGCLIIPNPLVMSFDIEVNSSIKGSMPNAKLEEDKVFQIGCIFGRQGSNEIISNHLLTLNGINKKYLSNPAMGINTVEVKCCETEAELLDEFAKLIVEKNPNIIIGYNIFEFDIDYMIKRSIMHGCYENLVKQTFHKYKYGIKDEIAWSSSAYKNQKFLFINAEGRLYIDLLPLIKRDYKFPNYRLKTVSSFFLGETKDPLTPQGIFKCYKIGTAGLNSKRAKTRNRARKAMAIVGKYCLVDTILPLKIFEKTKGWVGLVELSKVCNTSIFDLFTRGQQLKIFSQVYKICLNDNYVVEKNGYIAGANESYTGAHVFLPKAGVYDNVLPLDFCFAGDTMVMIKGENGKPTEKRIDAIVPGDLVVSYHENKFDYFPVKASKCMGEKETIELYFGDRNITKKVRCTRDHLFLVKNKKWTRENNLPGKWVKADEIYGQDLICGIIGKNQTIQKKFLGQGLYYGDWKVVPVYDIEVDVSHNFLANGAVVHNCSLYPSIMIAYNICYSTWVPEDSDIPENKCHVIEWHDHFNCPHDTVKRSGSKKDKKVMCAPRRYKFLKEPLGILPTMLKNLLSARDGVKILMKKEKDETMGIVLNCKQLALKISANSTYGSLGVRKGMLPFMPGAMCVTAIGREAIQKVARIVVQDHEAELVYGDSVVGSTPIILRDPTGKLIVMKIRDLSKDSEKTGGLDKECEEWIDYPQFKCFDSDIRNKEQCYLKTTHLIWTSTGWKKIIRIIRHLTKKKIYRITTIRGMVKTTEDHSLLDLQKNKIKPGNVKFGQSLFHSFPTDFSVISDISPSYFFPHFLRNDRISFSNPIDMQKAYIFIKNRGYNIIPIINEARKIYIIERVNCSVDFTHVIKIEDITEYTSGSPLGEKIPQEKMVYDIETEDGTFAAGIGEIIVSNTDSTYLRFPKIDKPDQLWDNANRVAKIVSDHFPDAMNIVFEQVIYARFLILTKKRYMSLAAGKDGKIFCDKDGTPQIQKKGVLLSRRDNSKFVRDIYSKMVIDVFEKRKKEEIILSLIDLVLYIFREKGGELIDVKDFVITKSVGEISEYKIRPLSDDPKKRAKRLKEMDLDETDPDFEEQYKFRSLPAQAQLFMKMKSARGENIGAGTRLEYVLLDINDIKAKGFEKIEDVAYFNRYKNVLKIDKLYYIKALIQPIDELFEIIGEKHFMKKFYKNIERKRVCLDNLKKYLRPKIFLEDIDEIE